MSLLVDNYQWYSTLANSRKRIQGPEFSWIGNPLFNHHGLVHACIIILSRVDNLLLILCNHEKYPVRVQQSQELITACNGRYLVLGSTTT